MLLRVSIPFNAANEYVREFKQAHRRDDDIAIVNAGMRARMAEAVTGAFSTLSSNVRCMSAMSGACQHVRCMINSLSV